jgi:hypothetical protein
MDYSKIDYDYLMKESPISLSLLMQVTIFLAVLHLAKNFVQYAIGVFWSCTKYAYYRVYYAILAILIVFTIVVFIDGFMYIFDKDNEAFQKYVLKLSQSLKLHPFKPHLIPTYEEAQGFTQWVPFFGK